MTDALTGGDAAFVEFDHVQKSYDGENLVVKDLNLSIAKGEFLTMLGPSGSGKTTCLMMLAGFETATHGEIRLAGREINNIPPHKRGIGMVFQNYALFPHMTVAENLAFPLEVRKLGKSEREQKVKRALDMVQMGAFGGRRPAQLSGGQQQRIALARALVFEPELVLMDEPLGALDKQLREHMQFEITRLAHELGITTVYVTHDQTEALTMSDNVAVFDDGRIQQLAPPVVLYEEPENSFVAQFIGENNTLEGVVQEIKGDVAVVKLDGGSVVNGMARPGPGAGSGSVEVLSDSEATLGYSPLGAEVPIDPVVLPSSFDLFGKVKVDGSTMTIETAAGEQTFSPPIALPPATYGELEVINGGTLTLVTGNYVFDTIKMQNGKVEVLAGDTVDFYSKGQVEILESSFVNSSKKPSNMKFHVLEGDVKLDLSDGGAAYYILNAPESNVELLPGSRQYGNLIADTLKIDSAALYFDPSAGGAVTSSGTTGPIVKSYQRF